MKWLLGLICTVLIIFLAIGGFLAFEAHRFLDTPGSANPEEVVITIAPGSTFDRVANDLYKAGAITDVERFRILARYKKAVGRIRAGEYAVNTGWGPEQVLKQITEGRAVMYRLSVREGLTWWATARAIEEQGFATYEDFKAVIHDPEFLRAHHIPFANAEGFLYPETYMMKKPRSPLDREQAEIVASTMVNAFWKQTEGIWKRLPRKKDLSAPAQAGAAPAEVKKPESVPTDASGLPWADSMAAAPGTGPQTPDEIDPAALKTLLVLASLVEKETGVPDERWRVSGVYTNRIRKNMLLQCDPTIIYGVGESFNGTIYRSQLNDEKNLYNTYKHPGLPPGPICSSGMGALKAAFMPEKHDFLYFVATGDGPGHTFTTNVNDHNKAVLVYRARMRAKGLR